MKVLFLTDGIHPFQLGGMQKHSLILTQLLAEREVELCVYHCAGADYTPARFSEAYGESTALIEEKVILFPKTDRLPGHYIRENKKYSELIFEDIVDRLHEFDLVYAQGFTGWHFIKMKQKQGFKLPIFVNFHGFEMFQIPPNTRVRLEFTLFKRAVKYNVLNADYVYSFGGQITEILKNIGVQASQTLLQSNGINEEWLYEAQANAKRNHQRTLTFIGRNERRKGIEELNKALREIIRREDLIFRFNFIGPIPTSHQIDDPRIIYHGEIRDAEKIKDILHHSDCLVCPSHSEGMPTVILEGMASGLAVIATDVGAVRRQIDGNGILLDKPHPKKLRNAVFKIINLNDEKLNEMKSRSVQIVKDRFLWSVIADLKLRDFKQAIQSKG